ncbi:unnamed protein product [Linum tenue]|uniref:Uncharacterized protein n=1 Tax=Linum tenue TaxID=586396 RepID=A0AAV0NVZ1_9ROSI|nr:unnamed protein product [Linum tenue]
MEQPPKSTHFGLRSLTSLWLNAFWSWWRRGSLWMAIPKIADMQHSKRCWNRRYQAVVLGEDPILKDGLRS